MQYPTRINLGSGKDYRPGWLNIDINPMWKADLTHDISAGVPPMLPASSIEIIVANDVLEHIPDLVTAMRNCLNLLKEGGEMHIYVPYWLSLGADQDPTHVRKFNQNSWKYYGEWAWYLGWFDACFDIKSLEYALSKLGKTMHDSGELHDVILRTPTAVDGMRVVLVKRLLQAPSADNPTV